MPRNKDRPRPKQRACPPPPPPPVAGGAAGYWWCGPGKDWRAVPSMKPEKPNSNTVQPDGPVEFMDLFGQAWRTGQRLIR